MIKDLFTHGFLSLLVNNQNQHQEKGSMSLSTNRSLTLRSTTETKKSLEIESCIMSLHLVKKISCTQLITHSDFKEENRNKLNSQFCLDLM